jgi:hypothetical protein
MEVGAAGVVGGQVDEEVKVAATVAGFARAIGRFAAPATVGRRPPSG